MSKEIRVAIPEEDYKKLKVKAILENTSIGQLVAKAIQDILEKGWWRESTFRKDLPKEKK